MISCPREPSANDKISATWMRELVRYVRAITPIAGPRMGVRRTPNGTHLSPHPYPHAPARPDNGCWKIVAGTRDETVDDETVTTSVRVFANQYYLDGECIHELELTDAVEDFVCQGELEYGEEYTSGDKPYVCLVLPATTDSTEEPALIGYETLADLQEAQRDFAYIVKPLYKFTHDGAVAVDFRNCPAMQMAEV